MGWNIFFVISWHWPGQGQTPLLACWQDGSQAPYWKTSLLLKYVFEDNTWPLSQSCFIESSDTLRIGDKVWQLSNQLRIKKVPLVFFLFTLLNSFAPVRKSSCRHFLASSKIPLGVHGRRPYYRTGFGHRASIESWVWNEICNLNDIFNCRLKGVDFSGFLIGTTNILVVWGHGPSGRFWTKLHGLKLAQVIQTCLKGGCQILFSGFLFA